jgi:hypothetical protein
VSDKPRVVVCSAIKDEAGFVVCGPRHFDQVMVNTIHPDARGYTGNFEQGFIDQFGVFMTRQEAWEVAKAAGQIKYRCGGDEGVLFSENLY